MGQRRLFHLLGTLLTLAWAFHELAHLHDMSCVDEAG
jgi:hypothetical protein